MLEKSTKIWLLWYEKALQKNSLARSLYRHISLSLVEGSTAVNSDIKKRVFYVNYVVQIVNFCGHLKNKHCTRLPQFR